MKQIDISEPNRFSQQEGSLFKESSLANLIESVNNNNLCLHYSNCNSSFKQRIDELNLQFFIETERILNKKKAFDKESQCQDNLLILLFKQISLYVSEIDRLNRLLKESQETVEDLFKEAKDEKMKRRTEIGTKDKIISSLRGSIAVLEESLLAQLKRNSNDIPPLCHSYLLQRTNLSIDTYSFHLICNKRQRCDIAIGRNANAHSDSIIMNGSIQVNNRKQLTHDLYLRQHSNENKPNDFSFGLTMLNQRKSNAPLPKKSGFKIIKQLKEAITKNKEDTSELLSSEREGKAKLKTQVIKPKRCALENTRYGEVRERKDVIA